MDIVTSNYLPGDPRLIDQIVYELKSQGIFDQFRKECIADVDTKPAYQNLSQRVEGSVMNFLKKQRFSEDMNKNQLREQLRKNISESGFLETGVERIVDQVVNPKINTIFLPKVEDVVYRYLGIEKPNQEVKQEEKLDIVDLLPNDLEAISPESVNDHSFNSNSDKKDESIETNENSLNSSNTKTEDESPPFELLEENTKFSVHEENSVDSHLSGISGLASHESNHSAEIKDDNPMDISQDVSQNSLNSEANLSIVTSEEDVKMEICEDSNMSENKDLKGEGCDNNDNENLLEIVIKEEKETIIDEPDTREKTSEKIEEKVEEFKGIQELKMEEKKEFEGTKSEDKETHESRPDSKKSHNKHKSSRSDKDRKDNKDKKSRSKSESKSKDKDSKSHSKHSSSSKDRDKEKKDYRNGKDKEEGSEKDKQVKKDHKEREKSKDKSSKNKEKLEKDKNKHEKDKVAKDKERSDKEKTYKEKLDKDKSDKEKTDRDKNRSGKEKSKSDRDKDKTEKSEKEKINKDKLEKEKPEKEKSSSSKHRKDKSIHLSKRDGSTKESDISEDKLRDKSSTTKDKVASSSSKHKESSNKDKDKSTKDKDSSKKSSLSSSSKSKEKDKERKGSGDSKSKSSDKHKRFDKDKSIHHNKTNSPVKKDKDKKAIDDHYSLKDKKSERRSTDRDSNDGSSKMSRNGSFTDSFSQSFKGSSKESSEVFSSGSGDSSNSDKMEDHTADKAKEVDNVNVLTATAPQAIKYIKPKFASNIHEAMKIMKIRKQLAKLERQNQLSLAQVHPVKESQSEPKFQLVMKELSVVLEKSSLIRKPIVPKDNAENGAIKKETLKKVNSRVELVTKEESVTKQQVSEESPMLKSLDLSMESFEALEARLAQEMSNVNYHMYGEEDDSYEYSSVSFSPVKKRKAFDETKHPCIKKISFDSSSANDDNDEVELVVSKKLEELTNEVSATKNIPITISDSDTNDKEIEMVSKQIPGPAEKINFIENGPVSDSITNVNIEDIKLVIDHQLTAPTEETITIESDENIITSSDFNDVEVELVDKQVNKSTEELPAVTIDENIPTIPDFITNVVNKENELVIEIKAFTEQGSLVNVDVPVIISDFSTNVDKEIALVKRANESVGETIKSAENEVISDSLRQTCDVPEELDVPCDETEIISHEEDNGLVENVEELVINDVQESYIKEISYDNSIDVENKKELDEHKKERVLNLYETEDVEMDSLQLDSDHNEDLEQKDINNKLKDGDEFRGFDDADRNNCNVIKFTGKIFEMEQNMLEKLNNVPIARDNIPELARIKSNKPNLPRKEKGIILKHGLSLEATIKEVTNMSSTIQDLLQKNGKKLFIKIDKIERKLPSKVLVSLQGMETNEVEASPVCEVDDVSGEEEEINREEVKEGNAEAKEETPLDSNGEETNQNGKIFKKPLNISKDVLPPKLNNNGLKGKKDCLQDGEWENDDSPCYYFVNSNSKSEKHLKVLNDMIGNLEKAVEKQSLQIQNNIPAVKTRGRKRKTPSTENNNSISGDCKPEPKRKHLTDAARQNGGHLCNTNVSQNQSFSLPLSPAESEKSDEHKKEEPLTVKTKRTGRVSNTKRYSSEDLYKPRPVLRYGSSRRRSGKQEHKS